MKKFAFALALIAFLASYSAAAVVPPVLTVTIDGTVYTDPYPLKIASMPIPGVKVYLQPQIAILQQTSAAVLPVLLYDSAITDATGHFAFPPVTAGYYSVSFQHSGYVTRNEDVYAAKDTTMRISLLASGAHGAVQGKVLAGCSPSPLAMPCLLTPIPKCTITVTAGPIYYALVNQAVIYPPISLTTYTAVTNDSGNYSIDSVPISSNNMRVTVTAAKAGFVSQSVDTGLWNMTTTMVNFTLAPVIQGTAGGDSVYTTPARPTTKDSITYNFYDSDACCCAQFVNPTVLVQDTNVFLSFSVNSAPCQVCMCLARAGKWYAFKGGRLAAGRYGIYKQESPYCPPGQACPAVIALPVKIGEVVVSSTAVSSPLPIAPRSAGHLLRQEKRTVTMDYSLERPAHVRVNVFNARGMLIGQIYNKEAGAGSHEFSWKAAAVGIYVMSVEINGVPAVSRTIVVSQ